MLIKFFKTTGAGASSSGGSAARSLINYLLGDVSMENPTADEKLKKLHKKLNSTTNATKRQVLKVQLSTLEGGARNPPAKLISGDPQLIGQLIDCLEFKHRYTSGVLSHASEDNATLAANPQILIEERALFEAVAFAGIPAQDRFCLWVGHQDKGRYEQHFAVPRVHPSTGKSFNIAPPGKRNQSDFDAVRRYINLKYGLASPQDAARRNAFSGIVNYRQNSGKAELKKNINRAVDKGIASGAISNRQDIIALIKKSGFDITRQGKDYLSCAVTNEHGKTTKIRIKGGVYEKNFVATSELRQALTVPKFDTKIDKTKELGLLWQQIESGVERRAEYVLEKFGTTHTGLDAIRDYAPENMAKANDSEHEAGKRIETSNSLIFEGSATYNASVTKHDSKREVNNKNTESHNAGTSYISAVGESRIEAGHIGGELAATAKGSESWMGSIQKQDITNAQNNLSRIKKQHGTQKQLYATLQKELLSLMQLIGNNRNDRARTAIVSTIARATELLSAASNKPQPKFGRLERTSLSAPGSASELASAAAITAGSTSDRSIPLADTAATIARGTQSSDEKKPTRHHRVGKFITTVASRINRVRIQNRKFSAASSSLEQASEHAESAILHAENTVRNTHKLITPSTIGQLAILQAQDLPLAQLELEHKLETVQQTLKSLNRKYHAGDINKQQYAIELAKLKKVRKNSAATYDN